MFNNKNILITGGTGSFGKKCTEVLLNRYMPKRLIVFSRDELKQYEMAQQFSPDKFRCIRYFLGDVRDKERLYRAFQGVDYVIHAAALKQVPSSEYNPTECIHTNITGAENVVNAAADCGVEKVVVLSTDKAVNPVNLYGATKLCSDKLFIAANAFTACKTIYSVVRYGNVMGSRGSVIPFFINKKKLNEPLPITDQRMTRFWITLEQSVNLALQTFYHAQGGEIFIPKIPSMRIVDLAKAIAPHLETTIVGIRPGEKLHEMLITDEDSRNTVDAGNYYIVLPGSYNGNREGFTFVREGFSYNSATNDAWMTVEALQECLIGQGVAL